MKQCPNPDCPVHQAGRLFNLDDQICPRCGSTLVTTTEVAAPRVVYTDPALGRVAAALGSIIILLVVFGAALGVAGLMQNGSVGANAGSGLPSPGPIGLPTALAGADATQTALVSELPNTPVVVFPTPVVYITPLPPSTGAGGTGGSINSGAPTGVDTSQAGATSAVIPGVSAVRLCRRVAAGEPCEPVSAYSSRDAFNLAVQAGFGTGGARSARVRWYGPNGALLYATEPVVPGRTGTYWIAFTLTQSQPWSQGLYRAEIYLDDVLYRQVDIPVVT
jgi:hypothetical protein